VAPPSVRGREELPARAYYAAVGSGRETAFDRALFQAAWIEGRDVDDRDVIRDAAIRAGLDADEIVWRALTAEMKRAVDNALSGFDRIEAPGVPTWVLDRERFWGKDRVDWLVREVRRVMSRR
jgi:predicted DsbA family dithiol-disulfide isomerase